MRRASAWSRGVDPDPPRQGDIGGRGLVGSGICICAYFPLTVLAVHLQSYIYAYVPSGVFHPAAAWRGQCEAARAAQAALRRLPTSHALPETVHPI